MKTNKEETAIKKYCLYCCNKQQKEVELCIDNNCSLQLFKNKQLTSLQAIKKRCKDCLPEGKISIIECEKTKCFLYPFRLGFYLGKKIKKRIENKKKKLKKLS